MFSFLRANFIILLRKLVFLKAFYQSILLLNSMTLLFILFQLYLYEPELRIWIRIIFGSETRLSIFHIYSHPVLNFSEGSDPVPHFTKGLMDWSFPHLDPIPIATKGTDPDPHFFPKGLTWIHIVSKDQILISFFPKVRIQNRIYPRVETEFTFYHRNWNRMFILRKDQILILPH